MSSIMQILRRIGGAKSPPTSGSAGQLALWKAGTAATDAASLYAHDGTQWKEVLDTSAQWTASGADVYRAAGKVGIGTATPKTTLDVNGSIRVGLYNGIGSNLYVGTGGLKYAANGFGSFLQLTEGSGSGNVMLLTAPNNTAGPDANAATTERLRVDVATGFVSINSGGHKPLDQLEVGGSILIPVSAYLGGNLYYGGGWKYREGGHAALLQMVDGNGDTILYKAPQNAVGREQPASPVVVFKVSKDGHITSAPTYAFTGAGSAVNIDSAGNLMRASSSLKYKKDVEALDPAIVDHAVKNLRPVWYRPKKAVGDVLPGWSHFGLIAEEVAGVEKRLVNYRTVEVSYDDEGKQINTPLAEPIPEDVDYARLSVLLLDYIQRLEKRVAALEARP